MKLPAGSASRVTHVSKTALRAATWDTPTTVPRSSKTSTPSSSSWNRMTTVLTMFAPAAAGYGAKMPRPASAGKRTTTRFHARKTPMALPMAAQYAVPRRQSGAGLPGGRLKYETLARWLWFSQWPAAKRGSDVGAYLAVRISADTGTDPKHAQPPTRHGSGIGAPSAVVFACSARAARQRSASPCFGAPSRSVARASSRSAAPKKRWSGDVMSRKKRRRPPKDAMS
mmetsp:Transcript_10011/g.32922  ORF Transcript_10011/g.32922 Transcript_10011/m.32922 type:complete len:227 (-) Transcript_10011:124-804(-)